MSTLWVWGIDCGSKCAGFGFAGEQDERLTTGLARWRREGERPPMIGESLKLCYSAVYNQARSWSQLYAPSTICFERPMGTHPSPTLMMHTGVIVLAVAQATGLSPWEINVQTWKRIHAENGTNLARKESLRGWGRKVGLDTRDQDELAGAAIALAARQAWNATPTVTA